MLSSNGFPKNDELHNVFHFESNIEKIATSLPEIDAHNLMKSISSIQNGKGIPSAQQMQNIPPVEGISKVEVMKSISSIQNGKGIPSAQQMQNFVRLCGTMYLFITISKCSISQGFPSAENIKNFTTLYNKLTFTEKNDITWSNFSSLSDAISFLQKKPKISA